jgi:hypothetical protein
MSITVMKQALEALESTYKVFHEDEEIADAITSLRQAIAEASENGLYREGYRNGYGFGEAAGKRQSSEWVGLTVMEAVELELATNHPREFAAAIEAKLKSKNGF